MAQNNPQNVVPWYDRYENLISLVGTLLTLLGLGVAIWQIHDTKSALIASNQYSITKDDSELVSSIPDDAYIAIFHGESDSISKSQAAQRHTVRLLSFASSIMEQKDLGLMTDEFWKMYHRNFCGFMRLPAVSSFWKEEVVKGHLDFPSTFVSLGSDCIK